LDVHPVLSVNQLINFGWKLFIELFMIRFVIYFDTVIVNKERLYCPILLTLFVLLVKQMSIRNIDFLLLSVDSAVLTIDRHLESKILFILPYTTFNASFTLPKSFCKRCSSFCASFFVASLILGVFTLLYCFQPFRFTILTTDDLFIPVFFSISRGDKWEPGLSSCEHINSLTIISFSGVVTVLFLPDPGLLSVESNSLKRLISLCAEFLCHFFDGCSLQMRCVVHCFSRFVFVVSRENHFLRKTALMSSWTREELTNGQITMQWHLSNHDQKENSSGKLIRLLSKNTVMNVGSAQKTFLTSIFLQLKYYT